MTGKAGRGGSGGAPSHAVPEKVPTDPIAFAMYVQERLDLGEELEDVLRKIDELDRNHVAPGPQKGER